MDDTNLYVNLAAGLFILPFFLFLTMAGQIADRYDKALVIRWCKVAELVIAVFAVVSVTAESVFGMLTVLFLLGLQSTFFGPLKYAILPQHLRETELVGGNAQIEMGTFVAILLGTIVGGVVAAMTEVDLVMSVLVVGVALVGLGSA